jgi:outer membrane protein assembly factor BamE (lipoprotein component of BamABCDE complex)
MRHSTLKPVPALACLAGLLGGLANCAPVDRRPLDTARSEPSAAVPAVVTVTATDYDFAAPDTVLAGWTTFRLVNRGDQPHMAQLVRLEPGMSLEQFLTAYEAAFRTKGPRPEWARRLGGPTVTAPQGTGNATMLLEPGTYVWICLFNLPDGVPHVVGHGMSAAFVVDSALVTTASQDPPRHDVVMNLTDYAFQLSAPLTAGRRVIRVENRGRESHEVSVIRLPPGRTIADLRAWLGNPGATPVEDVAKVVGGVSSLAAGAEAFFEVELEPGDYVLLCLVTAPDGRSHVEHGMMQQLTVT